MGGKGDEHSSWGLFGRHSPIHRPSHRPRFGGRTELMDAAAPRQRGGVVTGVWYHGTCQNFLSNALFMA